jgi:hypothetical protein
MQKLQSLVGSLKQGGRIVIETGNPFGRGYFSAEFQIEFEGQLDDPFTWGHADREWISNALQQVGCQVKIEASRATGGMFFFAIGQKEA